MAMLERVQPPAESPAQRYARDAEQQRGDWNQNEAGDLVYVEPTSEGGRLNRTEMQRGGDVYYTYDAEGNPVRNVDEDGRDAREYVDYESGVSANGAGPHDLYPELRRDPVLDAPEEPVTP